MQFNKRYIIQDLTKNKKHKKTKKKDSDNLKPI